MLEFAILGPLEVRSDGLVVPIRGTRQRALLALLLLHANEVVSSDRLIEELWGGEPRADTAVLRVRISQLRKTLECASGSQPVETRSPGYVLSLRPVQLDLSRFERLIDEGAAALRDDPAGAAAALREALALCRGRPLADFSYEPFAQSAIGRIEEMRLVALERRIDAELALGIAGELIGELETLVDAHPLREHFSAQLMLALYAAGRQAEALDVFRERRRFLIDELGIEPGPALQKAQRAILTQAQDRPSPPVQPPRRERLVETRKLVTVLVCDAVEGVDGPARDAEVRRRLRDRWFQECRDVLARHGGTVERFIGGAVTAVFGAPVAHEDDALRAVRAAEELRKEMAPLGAEAAAEWGERPSMRIGIETGEVIAGVGGPRGASISGEVTSIAARLQQAARENEILLGETIWSLVRGAVDAELATGLAPGDDRITIWRLIRVADDAPPIPRRFDTPFIGRVRELVQLRAALERTSHDRVPCLLTVLGDAGIGKSRLAAEARVDMLAEARVLVGRCLPYGQGVTYAALRQIVVQALGHRPVDALEQLLAEEHDGTRVVGAVSALLGLRDANVPLEEGFWGVRRLCETLARRRPLVLVFEDVQWAEPAMLDLIEYVAEPVGEAPLFLLCLARTELLDHRPNWGGENGREMVTLSPLKQSESELLATWLIRDHGAAAATHEVVEAAQGNPLFLEQLVALLADGGSTAGERQLPATVEAILAARLELLGPASRLVLERASVIGDSFRLSELARLVPSDLRMRLPAYTRGLVAKQLLRPTREGGRQDGYRFGHVLVREAAYRRLPKELRAELHERFAEELAAHPASGGGAGGHDEQVGNHFERAYVYRVQLAREDAHARRLAERATSHLATAAAEALARTDFRAVDRLLARAIPLMAPDDPQRAALLYDRGTSMLTLGCPDGAYAVLGEAIEAARAVDDQRSEWRARLDRTLAADSKGSSASSIREHARLAREGVSALRVLHDDRGLVRAWRIVGSVNGDRGRAARGLVAAERMLVHARRSGVYREEAWALWFLADAILIGPTPVSAGLARCEELLRDRAELRVGDVGVLGTVALLRAMQGEFDHGRQLIGQGRRLMERLGHRSPLLSTLEWLGELELLAGNWSAADEVLREASQIAADGDVLGAAAGCSAARARALTALGRPDEAEALVEIARSGMRPTFRAGQASWRSAQAAVHLARGDLDAAVSVAREAARILRATDLLSLRADVYADLSIAVRARGDVDEARCIADQACALYARKGNAVGAERIQALAGAGRDQPAVKLQPSS